MCEGVLFFSLFCLCLGSEGGTVGALALSGICLVGDHVDLAQRTVVFCLTVMLALSNCAADGSVSGIALGRAA